MPHRKPTRAQHPPQAHPPAPTASKAPATPEKAPASDKAAAPADKASSTNGAAKAEGAFAVQLAAFSDDKGANALAGKLKRAGYTAYTEPLKTSKGTLWRVRVGPYPSREAANAARDKLKSEGQNGIVAAAH
jgi:DedD protein